MNSLGQRMLKGDIKSFRFEQTDITCEIQNLVGALFQLQGYKEAEDEDKKNTTLCYVKLIQSSVSLGSEYS